jgi:beta-mannosidase
MYTHFSLDGEWQITGLPPDGQTAPLRLSAQVPGHVHTDLQRAGHIPDPFFSEQADACQWVEAWEWQYVRRFSLEEKDITPNMFLECEGLDMVATIFINGREAGHAQNMFVPHRFPVSALLHPGENTLMIRFTPVARALAGKPVGKYWACFSPERVFLRKTQCSFGWDWVHRFVGYGIWRSIRIAAYDRIRIADACYRVTELTDDNAALVVELDTESFEPMDARVTVRMFDPDGCCCAEAAAPVTGDKTLVSLAVAHPRRWWPNGYGEQPLYLLEILLSDSTGSPLDARKITVGLRTVALEQLPDAWGASFTLVVNGRRIFCKGGNWVPANPFPASIPEAHYDHLLRLAKEARATMLRSWGGGIYEPAAFWDACNRYGILVMQDFLLACAQYPEDDPEFLDALRVEFEAAIRMVRNHPCLVLWSGDNELGMNEPDDSAYNGRRIAESVSAPLCAALDPKRPYQKTSPYGGNPNNAVNIGDCHVSAWYNAEFHAGDMDDYRRRIRDTWGRFASEYVTLGLPGIPTIRRFAAPEDMADPTARVMAYHTKDNPYNGIDHSDHYHLLKRTAERLYGESDNARTVLRRMAYVQYEWNRLTCESMRRRMFNCSGLLFWMYNDCWPANGCSNVDFYGVPKAGYYGMKAGFRPVIACMEPCDDGTVRPWISNDTFETRRCEVALCFQPWTGHAPWRTETTIELPAMSQQCVGAVPPDKLGRDGVLVCDVSDETGMRDRATYFAGMPRDMHLPAATLNIEMTRNERGGSIVLTTDGYARAVCIEGDVVCSDNYFDMLPGESRRIEYAFVPQRADDHVSVVWWNGGMADEG